MVYSIPYIILLAIFGVLAFVYQKSSYMHNMKTSVIYLCAFILIFFFGFRGFICDDWIVYYQYFKTCSFEDILQFSFTQTKNTVKEPGFTALTILCKFIINDYRFFVFVCTTINTLLLFRFLKNRVENIPFAIVLYLSFGGFGMNTNMMRNSIAILIFINSLEYIEKREPLKYFALIALAASFHFSALIYLPVYFFLNKKINKWIYLTIFIIGNLVFILHLHIVLSIISVILGDNGGKISFLIDNYTSGNLDTSTAISIGYIERLLSGLLFFCYYNKLIQLRSENIVFINSFMLYLVLFFLLSEFQTMSIRMSTLFIFSYWILWGDLTKCFSIKNNRTLFFTFIAIYCILKMIGTTNLKTSEYDNVLFGAKSYEERLYLHNRYGAE